MAKRLTDADMAQIIYDAVHNDEIDCADAYEHFLEDLAELICDNFGGTVGVVSRPEQPGVGWEVEFIVNDCVPDDGGVFRAYDKKYTWTGGHEVACLGDARPRRKKMPNG